MRAQGDKLTSFSFQAAPFRHPHEGEPKLAATLGTAVSQVGKGGLTGVGPRFVSGVKALMVNFVAFSWRQSGRPLLAGSSLNGKSCFNSYLIYNLTHYPLCSAPQTVGQLAGLWLCGIVASAWLWHHDEPIFFRASLGV